MSRNQKARNEWLTELEQVTEINQKNWLLTETEQVTEEQNEASMNFVHGSGTGHGIMILFP